jgi:hypothetical protein
MPFSDPLAAISAMTCGDSDILQLNGEKPVANRSCIARGQFASWRSTDRTPGMSGWVVASSSINACPWQLIAAPEHHTSAASNDHGLKSIVMNGSSRFLVGATGLLAAEALAMSDLATIVRRARELLSRLSRFHRLEFDPRALRYELIERRE